MARYYRVDESGIKKKIWSIKLNVEIMSIHAHTTFCNMGCQMNSRFRGVRLFSRSKFANISGIQILDAK